MQKLSLKLTIIFHERSAAVSVMNEKNPLQCSTYYLFKVNFNIIPLSASGFSKIFSPCVLCDKISNAFFNFPMNATYPPHISHPNNVC